MEKIIPFKNRQEALTALDNGGRFYNLLTNANDGKISTAELAKAAGVFSDEQKMWIYFEIVTTGFSSEGKTMVIQQFSDDLQAGYKKQTIKHLLPSQIKQKVKPSQAVIVTGVPKLIDAKSELLVFIMAPITAGSVTTFSMIPIFEQYDVYEMKDEITSDEILIAHHTGKGKLPSTKISCGGVVKEFKKDKNDEASKDMFLEVLYYADC
jgi:hypothetical protein